MHCALRLHFPESWTAGRTTAFAAYVEVFRENRTEPFDLKDVDVPEGSIQMTGVVAFFAGDAPLGDSRALSFAHEC